MGLILDDVLLALEKVDTVLKLKAWVRRDLRALIPHATFLATLGKLYGLGSVATHRIDVDFSLSVIEELKNSAGALDDPLVFSWLRSGRSRYVELSGDSSEGFWREAMLAYGIRGMLISGVLDHSARRFAVFQFGNPFNGGSPETVKFVRAIGVLLSQRLWSIMESRDVTQSRHLVGHPTLALTPAELQIVQLIAQGLSNKQIARIRRVSDSTVKTQVQRTGAKLGATRRAEIVALAMPMLSPLPPQALLDYDDEIL